MIKLGVIALIVLSILGVIIWSIFSTSRPQTKTPASSNNPITSSAIPISEIKVSDLNIKPPQPIQANLFAPNQTKPSGQVKLSSVIRKILIELKSDSNADKVAIIYKGTCTGNGEIIYPLALLKAGASQSIWEISMEELNQQLPLSVKVFKDAKNLKSYTRCADIKIS